MYSPPLVDKVHDTQGQGEMFNSSGKGYTTVVQYSVYLFPSLSPIYLLQLALPLPHRSRCILYEEGYLSGNQMRLYLTPAYRIQDPLYRPIKIHSPCIGGNQ